MGCGSCTRSGGCETNKGPQRVLLAEVLGRVYPERTWGRPDDAARFGAGLRASEVRRLARSIAQATGVPAYYRPGAPEDLCDFVYVLCFGRPPALIEVRDRGVQPEADLVRDRYLRVAFSSVARAAAIQEVAVELDRVERDWIVRELPRPGVFDAKLLKRMQKIVDLLEASDIEHLDFGMVAKPAEGYQPGDYVERYGVEPALVNFLFYAQPASTTSTTVISATPAA